MKQSLIRLLLLPAFAFVVANCMTPLLAPAFDASRLQYRIQLGYAPLLKTAALPAPLHNSVSPGVFPERNELHPGEDQYATDRTEFDRTGAGFRPDDHLVDRRNTGNVPDEDRIGATESS
jgi:hypothetical protein